jgi:hypothetical protein
MQDNRTPRPPRAPHAEVTETTRARAGTWKAHVSGDVPRSRAEQSSWCGVVWCGVVPSPPWAAGRSGAVGGPRLRPHARHGQARPLQGGLRTGPRAFSLTIRRRPDPRSQWVAGPFVRSPLLLTGPLHAGWPGLIALLIRFYLTEPPATGFGKPVGKPR